VASVLYKSTLTVSRIEELEADHFNDLTEIYVNLTITVTGKFTQGL